MPRLKKTVIKDIRDNTFVEVLSATNSPKKAMIAAEPALGDRPGYAAVKAQRMLAKKDIQDRIQQKLEKMQPKALKTIDKLIISENEQIATANAWRVIEHLRGKPIARNVSLNATTTVEDVLAEL